MEYVNIPKYPKVESFCKMLKEVNLKREKNIMVLLEPKLDGSNIRYNGETFGSRNVIPLSPELFNIMMEYFNDEKLRDYLEYIKGSADSVYFEMITPKNSIIHRKHNLVDVIPFERYKKGKFIPIMWRIASYNSRIVKKIFLVDIDYWDLIYELLNIYKLNWLEFGAIEGVVIKLVKNNEVIKRYKFKPFLKLIEGNIKPNFDYFELRNDLIKFINEFQGDINNKKNVVKFWKSFSEYPFFYYIVNYTYTINKRIPELTVYWLDFVESLYEFLIEHL